MFSRFTRLAAAQPVQRARTLHTSAIVRNEDKNVTALFANLLNNTPGAKGTSTTAAAARNTAEPLNFSFGAKGGRGSRFSGGASGSHSGAGGAAGATGAATGGRSNLAHLFPLFSAKVKTTSNPVHFEISQPSVGRSIQVTSSSSGVSTPMAVENAYRRLNSVVKQSNMKRELRLRRTYEDGHTRMRREHQERNRKLFGNLVRKKIELIKLMKARGM